jgi:hypothetical protein
MSVSNMRAAIAQVYPGQGWKYKVAKMSDQQVIAVYFSFVRRKLI